MKKTAFVCLLWLVSLPALASWTVSRPNVGVGATGVVLTANGSGTTWSGTPFSISSGGCGASITAQSVTNTTTASITLTAGTCTGVITLSDGSTTTPVRAWTGVYADSFTRANNQNPWNGWTDLNLQNAGTSAWTIQSNALLSSPSGNSPQYVFDQLTRPSAENNADQLSAASSAWDGTGSGGNKSLWLYHRLQGGGGSGQSFYAADIEFNAGANQARSRIFSYNGTTLTAIGTSANVTLTSGHTYTLWFSSVGASPTAHQAVIYDTTGGGFDPLNPGSTTVVASATASDGTSGLQASGGYAVGQNGVTGFTVAQYNSYKDVQTAATAYQVVPSGTVFQASGVAQPFFVVANGSVGSSVTVTVTVTGAATPSPQTVTLPAADGSYNNFSLTSSTAANNVVAFTNSGGLTDPASVNLTITGPAVSIPVNDANLYYDAVGWYKDPGNAWIETNAPGNKIKVGVNTTNFGSLTLGVDVSLLTNAGVAAADYPYVYWSVNGGPATRVQLAPGQTSITLVGLTGLSGSYDVYALFDSITDSPSYDRWGNGTTVGAMTVRFTGLTAPFGSTTRAPAGAFAVRPKRCFVIGDSINEGINTVGTGTNAASNSNVQTYSHQLETALNCEAGFAAYAGSAYTVQGTGNVPTVWAADDLSSDSFWGWYDSVHPRLSGGLLPGSLDYVVEAHGTNDAVSGTLSLVPARVQGLLGSLRAAAPRAKLIQIVPFGLSGGAPYAESQITAGYLAYRAASADTRAYLVDSAAALGNVNFNLLVTTFPGAYMSDVRHPTAAGHALITSVLSTLVQAGPNAPAGAQQTLVIRR